MEIEAELLGECSLEEIKRGFMEDKEGYICAMCGERFEKGEIYTFSGRFYEGRKAITIHIQQTHHSVKKFLLSARAHSMGISELQLQILTFFAKGLTDREIADYLGVSSSTIRNHRYKLRERERQNKIFLALMETLEEEGIIGSIQGDRIKEGYLYEVSQISDKERRRVIEQYMTETGGLKSYPNYEKSRRIILEAILERFSIGRRYSEEEVDEVLSSLYKDYKLLRDELIAYDYLGRTNKGAIYWVKNYEAV